jgi:MFS family permease
MMVGAPALGYIGDTYGRRFVRSINQSINQSFNQSINVPLLQSLIFSALWALYYGLMSSITPEYYWLLALRSLLGFGVGGVPQA